MVLAQPVIFESRTPFASKRVGAAALYCSDGRLGEQMDEFLHEGLNLPAYDRVAVPGGAGCLAGHFAAWREDEGVALQLRFLIESHGLKRVVLIAHQDCAFYSHKLGLRGAALEDRQRIDLDLVAQRIRGFADHVEVDAYFARVRDGRVAFEPVEV